jgi:hypothetical protein
MMKIGQNWRNSILARETIRRANESFAALPDVLIAPGQSGRSFPFGNSKRLVRRSPRKCERSFHHFCAVPHFFCNSARFFLWKEVKRNTQTWNRHGAVNQVRTRRKTDRLKL